ncbi:MAG: TldD/PmbA family protein [Dehalococcoidia bacterium]|nr:MAG: TldD/PmbA family protein [Dehalococcoidia bacterium]
MKAYLESIRDKAKRRGVQFMDVRMFEEDSTSVTVQDRQADKVSQGKSSAVGLRVLFDGAWGFASTDVVDSQLLDQCLQAALEMAKASTVRVAHPGAVAEIQPIVDTVRMEVEKDPRSVSLEEKVKRVLDYEKAGIECARDKLCNTIVGYRDSWTRETICNTADTLIEQETIRTAIWTAMTAVEGPVRQMAHERLSEQVGFELLDRISSKDFTEKAAKRAVALLSARRAPSGKFPVVLHPSITGLLVHEALGHNAEADHVFNGESIIEGKIAEQIASGCVTIMDDATIPGLNGSYRYDSEGIPGQKRIIVENGILKGYLHSLETAARFGMKPNGSARAMNGHCSPIVRMSNTFIAPGKLSFEEMLKDIDEGIFMKGGHWGYVFCERGQYTCHAGEGWMIENGRLGEHLRNVSFSGMTLETLLNIDAVSRDLEFLLPGRCGKSGQGMHINAGGPYVRVKEVVVGGQE